MKNNRMSQVILNAVIRLGNGIEKTTGFVCVILFALMLLAALSGVFFRYVMNSPFQWTEEVCRYILIWLGFTAINMAIWRDEHIKIPFMIDRLPGLLAKFLSVVICLLMALYMVVLLVKGYQMTTNTRVTAQSIPISMIWIYMAVPISALLSLVQITLFLLRTILSPVGSSVAINKQ